MSDNKKQFIELAIRRQALKFGNFTLKSGRQSPYFFNAGYFNQGDDLAILGRCYAQTLMEENVKFDILFGPAYKGIPLATTTAVALSQQHALNVSFCFNRKEAKNHGEGGNLVGAELSGRVLIVDDVITAGTAIRESIQIIKDNGAEPAGVLVALDRQEKGQTQLSAIQEVEKEYNLPVYAIITLNDLQNYLSENAELSKYSEAMSLYQKSYGIN